MKLTDYIQTQRTILEKRITEFLKEKKHSAPSGLHTYSDTIDRLAVIIPKGKLLRGVQVILSHEMCNGKNMDGAFDAAAALEIIQAAILIQDDFMDNDYTRRGMRSVFAQYMDIGKSQNNHDPLLYGQSMATCVGDIGFFLAYELLSRCSPEQNVISEIVAVFSKEWQLVGAGQMMDVDFASRNDEPSEENVMNIYRYKTARYSFSLPLSMGAILASAEKSDVKKLDIVGENLGIIFQIKDDELGLFGDEKVTGKPIGSDIRENKKTMIRSLLIGKASVGEKERLKNIFGNSNVSKEDIEYVKNLIYSYGILDQLHKKMETDKSMIDKSITELSVTEEYRSLLHEFTDLVYRRSK